MNNKEMLDLRLFGAGEAVNTTVGITDATTGANAPFSEGEGLSEEMRVTTRTISLTTRSRI